MIEHADVIILCLPTPVKKNLTPDLSYITFTLKIFKNISTWANFNS